MHRSIGISRADFLRASLLHNMDETGMPLDPGPLRVATWKGHKNPSQVSSGLKSQMTVVGCVSAGGQCLPPMVIWDRKTLPPELAVGEVPGTIYGLSDKGWIDQELFNMWFHMHFLRYAPPTRPVLLLMDGLPPIIALQPLDLLLRRK